MRQIKFRGKSLKNKKWVYGDLLRNICATRIVRYKETDNESGQRADWDYVEVDDSTVGQFTGLTDNNGKEIYEGDILLCKGKHLYHVDWITDGFMIRGKAYGGVASIKVFLPNQREVTGNIYDNPELLK